MRTQAQARAAALAAIGTRPAAGRCLLNVRSWLGIPAKYGTAAASYYGATKRHPFQGDWSALPADVPFMYARAGEAGHIVYLRGGDSCVSTIRLRSTDTTDHVLLMPASKWMQYGYTPLGWTEDLNGVSIPWAAIAQGVHAVPFIAAPTLAHGSSGQHVRNFQTIGLRNYHTRLLGPSGADGRFGPATLRLAKAIQRYHGLVVDGVVGPVTQRAIYNFSRTNI